MFVSRVDVQVLITYSPEPGCVHGRITASDVSVHAEDVHVTPIVGAEHGSITASDVDVHALDTYCPEPGGVQQYPGEPAPALVSTRASLHAAVHVEALPAVQQYPDEPT